MKGLVVAAPSSGSGKTTLTLALLRAFSNMGVDIIGAKSGPDFIDPKFHEAACGKTCMTLDAWAMSPARIKDQTAGHAHLLIEGAMGLFDGAPPHGKGAVADLARMLRLPVLLVVDASHQAQSVAALVKGFLAHDPDLKFAGVIFNKVGSPRHARILTQAMDTVPIKIFGFLPRQPDLSLPSRHLGLVQAQEHEDLDAFIQAYADFVNENIDLSGVLNAFSSYNSSPTPYAKIPPPAQTISVARDAAFAFSYPHILSDWAAQGAQIRFFSPLEDQAPFVGDFTYLPGGYPELYAGRLASNQNFLSGLRNAKAVYGECGGYMVMGKALIDKAGNAHQMANLLDVVTSFEAPKLHLGYRQIKSDHGAFQGQFNAHEFHFSKALEERGASLFSVKDAEGADLPDAGLRSEKYSGSYMHLIDRA